MEAGHVVAKLLAVHDPRPGGREVGRGALHGGLRQEADRGVLPAEAGGGELHAVPVLFDGVSGVRAPQDPV